MGQGIWTVAIEEASPWLTAAVPPSVSKLGVFVMERERPDTLAPDFWMLDEVT